MKIMHRTIGVAVASMGLVLTTGCVSPNGAPDNTGTGALIGGAFGAIVGATADRAHPGAGALIGGAAGLIAGGLVGHTIDQEQQQRLQQQSPQTWQTIQHNDAVVQQQQQATASSQQPSQSQTPSGQTAPSQTTETTTPLTVDDIKALTAAGVKPDAITQEIKISQSKFSPHDITAAQQANPPVDPAVIEYMNNHAG
jgi:outer membrane lipoprotein SlyB